jgi:hypothetical protein
VYCQTPRSRYTAHMSLLEVMVEGMTAELLSSAPVDAGGAGRFKTCSEGVVYLGIDIARGIWHGLGTNCQAFLLCCSLRSPMEGSPPLWSIVSLSLAEWRRGV